MQAGHMLKAAVLGGLLPKMRFRKMLNIQRNTPVFNDASELYRYAYHVGEPGRSRDTTRALRKIISGIQAPPSEGFYYGRFPVGRLKEVTGDTIMGKYSRPGIFLNNPADKVTRKHERIHAVQEQMPFWLRKPSEIMAYKNIPGGSFFSELGAHSQTGTLQHFRDSLDFYSKIWDKMGHRSSSLLAKYPKLSLRGVEPTADWADV